MPLIGIRHGMPRGGMPSGMSFRVNVQGMGGMGNTVVCFIVRQDILISPNHVDTGNVLL
jgi:hypothetical protein